MVGQLPRLEYKFIVLVFTFEHPLTMASSPAVPDLTGAAVAFHIRHISRDGLGKHTSLYFARVWDLGLADQGYSRARTDRHVVIKAVGLCYTPFTPILNALTLK